MFFNDWIGLLRILIIGICAYTGLVFIIRVSGKRTLSKMNAFDFVVTVALGSTLATILLSRAVALVEGLLALALLVSLQYLVAWATTRSTLISRMAKSEPRLLVHRGQFLHQALRQERVATEEVLQALRSQGVGDIADAEAVIIESDGSFTVITTSSAGNGSTMQDVHPFRNADDSQ